MKRARITLDDITRPIPRRTRYMIRRSTYRGREGFLLISLGRGIYRTRIFTETREIAMGILAKLRENPNYHTTVADFSHAS